MNKRVGCEVGNFDTKFMTKNPEIVGLLTERGYKADSDSKVTLNIINVVSPAMMRRSFGTGMNALENKLDVTIKSNDEAVSNRWFVGGLALREGKDQFKPNSETEKSKNPMTMVMLLTTLAYSLYDPKNPIKNETVALGTCLPPEEYFCETEDKQAMFLKKIKGEHEVIFNDPAFNGARIRLNIVETELLPEGTGSHIANTYDWDGNFKDPKIEEKSVLTIDIGSIDITVSYMNKGEFSGNGFFGIKGGTIDVLREISMRIHEEHGTKFEPHEIDFHLRNEKPLLIPQKDNGSVTLSATELNAIMKTEYSKKAMLISNELAEQLRDRGIRKEFLHHINLAGGGAEFFKPGLDKYFDARNAKMVVSENARFKNVEGALKSLTFSSIQNESEVYLQE